MGQLRKNGIIYGGGDALIQPVIYSTEERCIGVWTDGKPLYEKTFIYPNIASLTTSMTFQTDLSNVDYSQISGGAIVEGAVTYKLPYVGNNKGMGFVFNNSSNNFLSNGNDSFTNADLYITLQYTKTTDTAGDGDWSPLGIPAVHYSEQEQVIGTWVDGKTLYEKVLTTPTSVSGNDRHFDISGLDNVCIEGGFVDIGTAKLPLNIVISNLSNQVYTYYDAQNSTIICGVVGWTPTAFNIIIRYTKSS